MVMRVAAFCVLIAGPAAAQSLQSLAVELNTAEDLGATTGMACRLSFLAENKLGADLSAVVFEVVVLNAQGQVDRLTLLDFQDLPQGRKRVRQFDLPGVACDSVAQLLINAANTCTGEGVDPGACMKGLAVTSRVAGTEVSG
ncbi:hypothetical protein [Pseudorhodobacter sp.]|uniref:hypothetical protein n=1 Tax=Pseudorhodobacter sp. TaxID=1934400 RepID=UPI002AFEEB76|nr:hypothetical protein [Pseudorhodobacter sp.]